MKTCYYELLGVEKDANAAEIKKVTLLLLINVARVFTKCRWNTIPTRTRTRTRRRPSSWSTRPMRLSATWTKEPGTTTTGPKSSQAKVGFFFLFLRSRWKERRGPAGNELRWHQCQEVHEYGVFQGLQRCETGLLYGLQRVFRKDQGLGTEGLPGEQPGNLFLLVSRLRRLQDRPRESQRVLPKMGELLHLQEFLLGGPVTIIESGTAWTRKAGLSNGASRGKIINSGKSRKKTFWTR